MEEELDSTETKLAQLGAKLSEAEKQADESERARRVLENRGQNDDDRLSKLQNEYEDVLSKNSEVEERYGQVLANFLNLQLHTFPYNIILPIRRAIMKIA